jgi:soluble lytic murein transglycosylase-like protein
MLALAAALPCLADEGVYSFVDAQGRLYLSNFKLDGRYRLLVSPARQAEAKNARSAGRKPDPGRFDKIITKAASRAGIDAALLHAVIAVESGYDARAVSAHGAAGLMQLMPSTAQRFRVSDVFDPAENVRGGAEYLAALLKMFDHDLRLALAAYNAGEGAVLRYGRKVPPFSETTAYVPKVVKTYRRYRQAR